MNLKLNKNQFEGKVEDMENVRGQVRLDFDSLKFVCEDLGESFAGESGKDCACVDCVAVECGAKAGKKSAKNGVAKKGNAMNNEEQKGKIMNNEDKKGKATGGEEQKCKATGGEEKKGKTISGEAKSCGAKSGGVKKRSVARRNVIVKKKTIYKAHDYGDEIVFNGIRASDLFKGEFGGVGDDAEIGQNEKNLINTNQFDNLELNACGVESERLSEVKSEDKFKSNHFCDCGSGCECVSVKDEENQNKINLNQFENKNKIDENPIKNLNLFHSNQFGDNGVAKAVAVGECEGLGQNEKNLNYSNQFDNNGDNGVGGCGSVGKVASVESKKQQLMELVIKQKAVLSRLKAERGNAKLRGYNSGEIKHLKQLAFHKCKKRNRWVFGGNRSGKTECGAVECVWLCRGIHPFKENKPRNGWVVSLTSQVQRDVAQEKVLSYLNPAWIADIVMSQGKKDNPSGGIIDYILIKNVFGGVSKLGFRTCDQGREKFQGASLDFVWFDEEPPEEIYKECRMRVLDKAGEVFGTMTPLKGLTWVYNAIYLNEGLDDEVWCEFMEWADNPYLNAEEVKALSATMSSEELEARRYGKFAGGGGLVYSAFDPNVHIIEPFDVPKEWFDNISIDPGLHNPLSCHFYAVDYDGNVYVIAEHYDREKDLIYHSEKIKQIADRLGWKRGSNGMLNALIDSAAQQHTLNGAKSVAELFYDLGINVSTKVNKDLFAGISRVRTYLKDANGDAHLYIFSSCVNMIREIKGYFFGNDDAPIKKDDHAMDELRYYIMSRPEPPKIAVESEKCSDAIKYKHKLMRKLKYAN